MITAEEIASLIKAPEKMGEVNPQSLGALAEKYPYTQVFSLLYLQSLGQRKDLRFDEELIKHSYRITDRARLFRLIHDYQDQEEVSSVAEFVEEQKTSPAPVQVEESVPEIVPELSVTEEILAERNIETVVENTPKQLEDASEISPANVGDEIEEIKELDVEQAVVDSATSPVESELSTPEERELTEQNEEEPELAENDPLADLILQHAAAASYQLEDLSGEEIERLDKRKEEREIADASSEQKLPSKIEIDAKQSFTSWFSYNRNALPEDKAEQNAVRSIVHDSESDDPSDILFGEVEKPKKEFFSPIRKAKESLREDDLPVSETLAKIYAMQGNYPKAIRAYEQLCLINPEKKTFFATLIADLEQKLNLK